jgi:hypothetical protein
MNDPRQAEVWGKKPEVADRTLNERKYCKLCDYYYSEMFTCPICYGDDRAVERIIKLLEQFIENSDLPEVVDRLEWLKDSIDGEVNEARLP